jgi:prepilin signal peptidase PulO-like enzyme (type II secretory pathway)
MWEELSNSKMFWIVAAVFVAVAAGAVFRKLTNTKYSLGAVSMPLAGLIVSLLYLPFVKLNVEYYDVKYTLTGIVLILVLSLIIGYILNRSNPAKSPFWTSFAMIYAILGIVVFYIFYKDRQVIDIRYATPGKSIYLLLKNQDAGYYQINENGIGYTGITGYINGFRPEFTGEKTPDEYDHTPYAVDIPTSKGIAHALLFKATNGDLKTPDLDSLFSTGSVKPSELLFGDLPK